MTEQELLTAFYKDITPKNDAWDKLRRIRDRGKDQYVIRFFDVLPQPYRSCAFRETTLTRLHFYSSVASVFNSSFFWAETEHGSDWKTLHQFMNGAEELPPL